MDASFVGRYAGRFSLLWRRLLAIAFRSAAFTANAGEPVAARSVAVAVGRGEGVAPSVAAPLLRLARVGLVAFEADVIEAPGRVGAVRVGAAARSTVTAETL